jgi:hypothetical protein
MTITRAVDKEGRAVLLFEVPTAEDTTVSAIAHALGAAKGRVVPLVLAHGMLEGGGPILAIEDREGCPISEVTGNGVDAAQKALEVIFGVALALRSLHVTGFVHGSIQSANVLIHATGGTLHGWANARRTLDDSARAADVVACADLTRHACEGAGGLEREIKQLAAFAHSGKPHDLDRMIAILARITVRSDCVQCKTRAYARMSIVTGKGILCQTCATKSSASLMEYGKDLTAPEANLSDAERRTFARLVRKGPSIRGTLAILLVYGVGVWASEKLPPDSGDSVRTTLQMFAVPIAVYLVGVFGLRRTARLPRIHPPSNPTVNDR